MKTQIVSITDEQITLSSSLNASSFGKTNHARLLEECGLVATFPRGSTNTSDVIFSDWQFDGTKIGADGIAFFTGKSLGAGKTLYEIFAEGTDEAISTASVAISTAISAAIAQQTALHTVGAEGMILFEQPEQTQVLFLPADIFERCANNTEDSYADFQGAYIRKGLDGKESLLFTRAVLAYRALCGTLPYTERDLSRRQADIFDARFTPTYLILPQLDADLSSAIDCGLQVSAELRPLPGERRFVNEKDVAKRNKILAAAERFSPTAYKHALDTLSRQPPAEDASLVQQRAAFLKKQERTIRRNRFIRRNKNRITVGIIAVVLGVWAITSFQKENRGLATSKGLTSWQTTQALYATIHQSNVPHLRELAKGKHVKNLIQIVSGLYVTNRSRLVMNQEDGTVSPAEWLYLKNRTQFWQYGLTQLQIDGAEADSAYSYPTRADKPERLAAEDGIVLKQGATVQHTAHYYLVNNDGSARISTNKVTDTVTLTWKRGRWIVTNIESKSKDAFVFTKDYTADYAAALKEADGDIVRTAQILREKYDWMPTDREVITGERTLRQKFRLTN